MDRKRELTSVDLAALARELGRYEGAKVDKAYLYGDDLLRLKLRDFDRGRVELLVDVGETKHARVAAPEHVPDAPGRPPNFAKMLRNRISGADFAGAEQYEFDRILQFSFERSDANTTVVAELFADGNVAVLDGTGEVIDCLETVRLKSRTVAPGSQYQFPSSRFNPLTADYDAFAARMRDSDTDLVKTLATQLNFGGFYGEELCTRAGVEKALPISEAGDEEFRALYDAVDRLVSDLRGGRFDPRVYYEDGRRVDVSPFPLAERERLESEAFDSFLAALDDYFTNVEYDDGENESGGEPARPDFESEIEKRKRIIQQQESAIEGFEEEASALREGAELLYANYDLVDEILSTVRAAREEDVSWDAIAERFAEGRERGIDAAEAVVDVDGSDGTVTVALDEHELELMVAEGVEKNADRLYEEAKRIEEKKTGALDAIENTRKELADLKRRREEWEAGDDDEQADDEEESREVDWLARRNVPVRQSEKWYDRFRWFRTSDCFLVIGGRNAEQNEEIVKKYLSRADRFFHAQAHGGPATVLKATEPSEPARDIDIPERSRREAAQFAVSYSSVWKDGRFAGDVYEVAHDQVTKTPESGEYLEKGGFAIRGDRTYYDDTEVGVAVGITCEPETRVIGGPPDPIHERAETSIEVEPGRYAQNDMGKMLYREFKDRFVDDTFVRKVASPDRIQEFLPPGGSRIVD